MTAANGVVVMYRYETQDHAERPSYPESMRVGLDESKHWSETLRTKRTCMYCRKVYKHQGAAVTCEHSHKRGGSTNPEAKP